MGLDMYLMKKLSVYGEFKHREVNKDEITITTNKRNYTFKANEVSEVTFQVLYWRKANAIHDWFVQNVQNGEDDCQEYWITRDKLVELRDVCKSTLDILDKADFTIHKETDFLTKEEFEYKVYEVDEEELELQPKAGFFFGSLNLDTWYYNDIKRTLDAINKELKLKEDPEISYHYHSSW